MYHLEPELTKELILSNVSQEEIFEHFLNIKVQTQYSFCSPLRSDKHPTCTFKWINDTLFYRDWSEAYPKNCFQIVKDLYLCDFYNSLQIIKSEMLEGKELKIPKGTVYKRTIETSKKHHKSDIQVSISNYFQPEVKSYLRSYSITALKCKKFNVYPISRVFLNKNLIWAYSSNDPAIGYYFGKDDKGNQRWKIYFYKRDNYRFIGNTNRINGWIQLPEEGDLLIITKSLKDVICFDQFNIPAIAMQNESTIPYDYIIENLQKRFNKIISFYDFDRTGVVNANKLRKLYNIPYFFLTNGRFNTKDYGSKDFSDFIQKNTKSDCYSIIECLKTKVYKSK